MVKKIIKYTDIEGVQREEEFYFNLTKAEVMELQLETPGGFGEYIQNIVKAQDVTEIVKVFKKLILKSYGVKSADGKYLDKSDELSKQFSLTEAFSELYMELATNADAASAFINGIIPNMDSIKKLNM